jgi:hypothetical protein
MYFLGPALNRSAFVAVLPLACLLTVIAPQIYKTQLSPAEQLLYANAKPYFEEPPEKLIAQIPELQGLRPAVKMLPQ